MPKYVIEITLRNGNGFQSLAVEGRSIPFEAKDEEQAIRIWARGRDAILDLVEETEKHENT